MAHPRRPFVAFASRSASEATIDIVVHWCAVCKSTEALSDFLASFLCEYTVDTPEVQRRIAAVKREFSQFKLRDGAFSRPSAGN